MSKPSLLALQSEDHQIGADSWSRSATLQSGAEHGSDDRTDERAAARLRCRDLVHEGGLTPAAIREALRSELGVDIPQTTLGRWIRADRLSAPPPDIGDAARRALRLCSSELKRLETQNPAKLDLERLQRCAQILKTLQGLTGKAGRTGATTLQDLSGG